MGSCGIWSDRDSARKLINERKLRVDLSYLIGGWPARTSRDRRVVPVLRWSDGAWFLRENCTLALSIQTDERRS